MKRLTLIAYCLLLIAFPSLAVAQESATEPAKNVRDTLREKVEEKITQLANKPKAKVGKITDIQNGSILLETKNGAKQLKLGEELTIVDNRPTTAGEKKKKTIEIKDLVLGDIIVAMGYLDTKDILEVKRILVIGELPTTTRRAVSGTVTESNAKTKSLTIKHPKNSESWVIKTDLKTQFTEKSSFSGIKVGARVTAVGDPTKEANTILAKLIHIIQADSKDDEEASPTPVSKPASPAAKPSTLPTPKATP